LTGSARQVICHSEPGLSSNGRRASVTAAPLLVSIELSPPSGSGARSSGSRRSTPAKLREAGSTPMNHGLDPARPRKSSEPHAPTIPPGAASGSSAPAGRDRGGGRRGAALLPGSEAAGAPSTLTLDRDNFIVVLCCRPSRKQATSPLESTGRPGANSLNGSEPRHAGSS